MFSLKMQHYNRAKALPTICMGLGLLSLSAIAGCAGGRLSAVQTTAASQVGSTASATKGATKGAAHGGQQPVVGAHIQLWAAGSTGYGSPASSQLSGSVQTDANGGFALYNNGNAVVSPNGIGNYTCPSSSAQMYITATGGNPGAGTNSAVALMAALGNCSGLTASTYIVISEETTVATVFSLQQFMSATFGTMGSWSIGAPASNSQGLINAFATVNNLVNTVTGLAWGANSSVSSPPAYVGTVTTEVGKINLISNVLAACVNSSDVSNSQCPGIFLAATPSGPSPVDTIQLALMMAQNPAYNVATLAAYSVSAAPFQPTSISSDWTIGLTYAPTVTSGGVSAVNTAYWLGIDQYGNVWVSNSAATGSVVELSNSGALIAGPITGFTASGGYVTTAGATNAPSARTFISPKGVAIDLGNNVWVTNEGDVGTTTTGLSTNYSIGTVALINGSTTASTPSNGSTSGYYVPRNPYAAAVDGNGNAWFTFYGGTATQNSKNVGGFMGGGSTYTIGGGIGAAPFALAIDTDTAATGGPLMWVVNNASCAPSDFISRLYTTGTNAGKLTATHYTMASTSSTGCGQLDSFAAGSNGILGIVVDHQNNVWITDSGKSGGNLNPAASSNSVTVLVPTLSAGVVSQSVAAANSVTFSGGGLTAPQYLAIDGNNTAWVTNATGGGISQLSFAVAAGSPTVTAVSPAAGYVHSFSTPAGVAVDSSGNVWVANNGVVNYLTELVGAAGPVVTPLSLAIKNNAIGVKP